MDQSGQPLTTFVIVNFNAGSHLADCVASVFAQNGAQPEGSAIEVVVVDNQSSDDSLENLARQVSDPRLRILRNQHNLGFARACNQGVADSSGDLVCLLNPDAILPSDALAQVRSQFNAHPNIGLAGVQVVSPGGQPLRATWRRLPTPWRAFVTFSGLERAGLQGVNSPPEVSSSAVLQCEAVSGACVFLRRSVWDRLGGLDEGFFLHCEDLDLFRRIQDEGLDLVHLPRIKVLHHQGVSSSGRPVRVAYYKHRGMVRYLRKHHSGSGFSPGTWIMIAAIWLRFCLLLPVLFMRRLWGRIRGRGINPQGERS